MSANNPSTASLQQASPDNAPLGAGPTLPPDINAGATGAKHVRQTGPDTAVCANNLASRIFHTAGLSQARDILGDGVPYLVCLPTDHLWDSCPLDDHLLAEIKSHVVESGLLSEKGEWSNIDGEYLKRENYAAWSEDADEAFAFFSRLFNTILGHLRQSGRGTSVQEMVHAVSEPESNRRPDAFLHMATETPPVPGKFRWRDLTCPFEYKFANGGAVDYGKQAMWCLHHIMRSDPRRMFSFGSTVCGTKFRIWFLCRTAPFTFTPFDWFDDPDSLLKFFTVLATSSVTDLGFDTNIERVGESDLNLQFTVDGRVHYTSKLLFNIGANEPTGRGTWVFKVNDQAKKEAGVIKDCWLEDHPGEQMEHEVVAEIKNDMDDKRFRKYFININGYRKTYASGRLNSVCKILENKTLVPRGNSEPDLLVPALGAPKSSHTADQDRPFQPDPAKWASKDLPHPRLRYQVVYNEAGTSLFEVTSFADVFRHIVQAADGLHCLHQAGWVHGDFCPGNIIVVEGEAKVTGLDFAKRRSAKELKRLTNPRDPLSPGTREICTRTSCFVAIEVEEGHYLFDLQDSMIREGSEAGRDPRTESLDSKDDTDRIFLQNPLHDYESIWWIAVWFVFYSKPEGVADDAMEEARDHVYWNRSATLLSDSIERARRSLPIVLKPLGEVLVKMKGLLVHAYKSFEKSFDGSEMLKIFPEVRGCLELLAKRAQGLVVTTPGFLRLSNVEVEQFNATAFGWEREGGAERQPTDADRPYIGPQAGDGMLGKRTRVDFSPDIHRAAKRGKFEG